MAADLRRILPSRPWAALLALLGCACLWSLGGPLIKLLDGQGGWVEPTPGLAVAFYRSLIGGLILLPLAWRQRDTLRHAPRRWLVGSVITFTLMTLCFVLATMQTAAANAIILQYTSVIWVFLLSPLLLGEHPTRGEAGILGLAMAGIAVIFVGNGGAGVTGLLIALLSGFGYGALTIAVRGLRRVSPLVIVCMNCLGSAVLLLFAVAWTDAFALTAGQLGLVVIVGVLQFALPYVLFSIALRGIPAYRAALFLLLETVLNPVLTWLAVGECVPTATLIGGPLIVAGVAGQILLIARRQRARTQAA